MNADAVQVKTRTLTAEMYYKNTLVLKYGINYPWFESSDSQSDFPPQKASRLFGDPVLMINQQYAAKAIAYQQHCETSLFQSAADEYDYSVKNGYPIRVFEAVVNYNVTYNKDCTLSLYFDQYEYTGGAHGMTVRFSDTWNLQYGSRIELSEIYPTYQTEIIGIITADIAEQMESGSSWYFDDYEKNVTENFNPENFYLTYAGLVVYFQLYEIAPYASGIPEFVIPYSGAVKKPSCK